MSCHEQFYEYPLKTLQFINYKKEKLEYAAINNLTIAKCLPELLPFHDQMDVDHHDIV